jgi:hypothetical protein
MKLTDRLRRWWRPAQWQEDHPLSEHELIHDQLGLGSYDRVDVDRDFRKP